MSKFLRAVRGATTLDKDDKEEVFFKTQELLSELLKHNSLIQDDVVSIIFTATPDIVSAFPATAARMMGLDETPLLGAVEQNVVGAPPLCIRMLMHCYLEVPKNLVQHVYLHGAVLLRPDLSSSS